MHIPSGASQTIDILPFADALALSGRSGEYDISHWIYVPDFYTEYRYILGTRGDNPLICIGIYSENICKMPLGVIRLRSRKWINDVTKGACA